ncbi:hypothetical protein C497_06394 [Halalkalicoccus jeotgali B3]|uniref:Uncharacterized protein n=1 Tax=Halalkalicoccus jeotgali (strain DSM 18796 / CECT 7217 / JCM 14584 / KCTC 4019 / B3) TaxID=795797 RepID=L9VNJ1_HALJB|nr:hypothetical protein C497_06394 [Halalkalicoccus jeotgali B3]
MCESPASINILGYKIVAGGPSSNNRKIWIGTSFLHCLTEFRVGRDSLLDFNEFFTDHPGLSAFDFGPLDKISVI